MIYTKGIVTANIKIEKWMFDYKLFICFLMQDSSFTALTEATMPMTISNDEEMNDVKPSLEPCQQDLSTQSTSNANFIDGVS